MGSPCRVLSPEKELQLYVDGEPVATKTDVPFITKDPIQIMEIGMDGISPVGEYASPFPFTGAIDEVRPLRFPHTKTKSVTVWRIPQSHSSNSLVLACSFNNGKAADHSGRSTMAKSVMLPSEGSFKALHFAGKFGQRRTKRWSVEHNWNEDIPYWLAQWF